MPWHDPDTSVKYGLEPVATTKNGATSAETDGSPAMGQWRVSARRRAGQLCEWCGTRFEVTEKVGRRRRYCGRACRQRAYERRTALARTDLPADAVVFSTAELTAIQDRMFQLRCAAEDIVTAARDGAPTQELAEIAAEIAELSRDLERLR